MLLNKLIQINAWQAAYKLWQDIVSDDEIFDCPI
jgi:hypothetical protein